MCPLILYPTLIGPAVLGQIRKSAINRLLRRKTYLHPIKIFGIDYSKSIVKVLKIKNIVAPKISGN